VDAPQRQSTVLAWVAKTFPLVSRSSIVPVTTYGPFGLASIVTSAISNFPPGATPEPNFPDRRAFEHNFPSRRDAVQRNSNAGCGLEKLIPQHARLQWRQQRRDDRDRGTNAPSAGQADLG
jgi:hypothetical protein